MTRPVRLIAALTIVGACLLGGALDAPATAAGTPALPEGRQVGTYDALVAPDYDAVAPVSTVLGGRSTIGLGTFDRLDGELVVLGGVGYRIGTDGVPRPVAADARTPFAQSVAFAAPINVPVPPGTTCAALDGAVAAAAGADASAVVAVRVRGTFTDLVTRSVEAQPTPYPSLADAVAGQVVFALGERRAVLVGFRTGPQAAGLGAPGLHLHGLTADRSAGGHVLSCVAGPDVQLSLQPVPALRVVVGSTSDGGGAVSQ